MVYIVSVYSLIFVFCAILEFLPAVWIKLPVLLCVGVSIFWLGVFAPAMTLMIKRRE